MTKLKYLVKGIKNPQSSETSYYAQVAPVTVMDIDDVVNQIEKRCTLTEPDIRGVIMDLQYVVIQALKAGYSVRLGDLGSFRPTIHSSSSTTADEVSSSNILKVNCVFTPGAKVKKGLSVNLLSFEKTSTTSSTTTEDEETA